jgi:hypothetical protein
MKLYINLKLTKGDKNIPVSLKGFNLSITSKYSLVSEKYLLKNNNCDELQILFEGFIPQDN